VSKQISETGDDSLSEKPLAEIVNNALNHPSALVDDVLNDATIARQVNIGELYSRGRLNVHLHFAWDRIHLGKIETEYFCAIFRGLPFGIGNLVRDFLSGREGQIKGDWLKFARHDNEQAVFIEDVQFRESPQYSRLRLVRSVVGLTLFDFCKCNATDERFNLFFDSLLKTATGNAYREGCPASRFGSSLVQQCELENKVIKGGSEIMDAIPDNQRQEWIKRLRLWQLKDKVLPLGINFVDGGNTLSAIFQGHGNSDSLVKVNEVVLRSIEL
jgi:hypothetical protein